ncbi:MAG TPA: NrdJb [Gammaproteobacteria bacterium]|nr:NrdJb [Gammaproteobacteria bacterium]|tara:strand:+ start:431 stop:1114 length:684 start_codon:yes stop_codon:yes gene_type:complete
MAIKIEKNIVAYSIKKEEEEAASDPALPTKEMMHEEIERPEELRGYTYKIKTPLTDHAMYITINDIVLNEGNEHEQEYPFEVFINSKNMEQFQWILALTRVISAVFRKGGDATFLAEELKQVFDPQGGYFKRGGKFMPSLVAEIGEVLETHMRRIGLIEDEELSDAHKALIAEKRASLREVSNTETAAEQDAGFPPGAQLCMKCSTKAMIMKDGCMTCLNCGESKCG